MDDDARGLRRDAALTAITGVALLTGVTLDVAGAGEPASWVAYAVAYLAGGVPAGADALRSLRRGVLDIDLLMVTAALAAAAVGEPRDGAILLFLFSLAGTLEAYAMGRTKRAVDALLSLRPDEALRRRGDGSTERVAVEALAVGDVVLVAPGERIAADGRVLEGASAVDQAAITGESVPVDKVVGDEVFAATVNGYGALAVAVTKPAAATTVARMIALVTEARAQRSPSQRVGDWFGRRYTGGVLAGSVIAFLVLLALGRESGSALYTAATLLVAASPCAVVISVPAAVLSALAAAARGGVLFKGGAALETLGSVRTVAFDKTGTLTRGRPLVREVVAVDGDERALLGLAASLERRSEHPLARAVVDAAVARDAEHASAEDAVALPGRGMLGRVGGRQVWVGTRSLASDQGAALPDALERRLTLLEARGDTIMLVGREREVVGAIALADAVRDGAASALRRLRDAGIARTVMLTGDHAGVAHAVAGEVGIAASDVHAGLLPEEKLEVVARLRDEGPVAYVGDGVNDAAALARADVGIAMGVAGSDVAIETADVALLSDDLSRLEAAYRLSRRANRIVRQNLAVALGAMAVLVVLTLVRDLPLPVAVIGHEGGTLLVVANGLRLLAPITRRAQRRPGRG